MAKQISQDEDDIIEKANKLAEKMRLKEKSKAKARKETLITWRSEFEKPTAKKKITTKKKTMPEPWVKKSIQEGFKEEKRVGIERGAGAWPKVQELSKKELLKKAKEAWG